MADITVVPMTVNITIYAGDTLNLRVIPAAGVVDGLNWSAQIRLTRAAPTVSAAFVITPPASPGQPASLLLPSDLSETMTSNGTISYAGVWDCQCSAGGNDPVVTLMQGSFTVLPDVTRTP